MPESTTRPVALLVTRNFPPLLGGMENVNQRLLRELAREWRVGLCGPEGCAAHAPEAEIVRETPVKPLLLFFIGLAVRASALARKLRPTVVIAGSGLSAPMAWAAARLSGASLVVYLHGLDIIAPSRVYQLFWLPFIRACDLVLVNSRNTGRLAAGRGVVAHRIQVLHPGTDVPDLDPVAGDGFRDRLGLNGKSILLSVGRLTQRKGLAEFVANVLPAIVATFPQAVLLVIGEEANDALHTRAGSERDRILLAARENGVESNIRFIGHCSQSDLSAAYQAAQVHVFPVLDMVGDVEGFGMVALEAAAHGLRTVAYDVGGVADAVEDSVTGSMVPSGEHSRFAAAVLKLLESPQTSEGIAASRDFAANKDWAHFGARLRALLEALHAAE